MWNPEANEKDREQSNAMAARGYLQAFQAVQQSIEQVLRGKNPGLIADEDHGTWYDQITLGHLPAMRLLQRLVKPNRPRAVNQSR